MRDRSRQSNRDTSFSSTASVGILASPVGAEVPSDAVPIPGRYDRPILRLWARWLPELRGRKMAETMILNLEEWHRELCVRLFKSGISERQIRRNYLDSPWLQDDERGWIITEFLATHRDRQGRI